ncbi:hypothetical protein [Streptomyces sp. NPDC056255]
MSVLGSTGGFGSPSAASAATPAESIGGAHLWTKKSARSYPAVRQA